MHFNELECRNALFYLIKYCRGDNVPTIGERLRYLIRERGLDQKQFAELFGLKISTLNGYVTNYRTPDVELQKRFADYFGVSVDFLIGRTDDKLSPKKAFVGSNLDLIKGSMTYPELSQDIVSKLCLSSEYADLFSPAYLEGLAKGMFLPTPQRVALLSAYAGVSKDFFYSYNTIEDLSAERRLNSNEQPENITNHLSNELHSFIMDPENTKYIKFAYDVKNKGIDPDDIISFALRYK